MTQQRLTEAAVRPTPLSLTQGDLDEANHPIQRGPAVPVRAWACFRKQPVITDAFAVEWNDRAVHVEWSMLDGRKPDAGAGERGATGLRGSRHEVF